MSATLKMQQRGASGHPKPKADAPLAAAHEIPAQAGRRGAVQQAKPKYAPLPADIAAAASPREVLVHEFMEPLGLSCEALAREMGVSEDYVWGIANGDRITQDAAARLAKRFGTSADLWMNLQKSYDGEIGAAERPIRRRGAIQRAESKGCPLPSEPMPVETRAKRQGARLRPEPKGEAPLVATDPAARQVKRGRANPAAKPSPRSPSPAPVPAATPVRRKAVNGSEPQTRTLSADYIAAICAEIVSLQRLRRFCITSQSRCDRSIESLIASRIGFRIDATEKDRKAVFARAQAYRERVEEGGEGQTLPETQERSALSAIDPFILLSAASRGAWDVKRDDCEKKMRRLAMSLPVWPFAKAVRGLGELGLARLIGEAGILLGDYRTVSGLWKRLGLAVIDGERQRKKSDKDEAAAHGYSPKRRAEAWSVCSDSMFRQQWRGADEEKGLPARPIGPYGEVYAKRRAHTECRIAATEHMDAKNPQKWTKGRCHNDARRVMTKRLLLDLWLAWRNEPFVPFEMRRAA